MSDRTSSVPAVAYLRASTDKQDTSVPDQRTAVAKMAAERGYTILREYVDDGVSGDDTEKRAGFLAMIADAERAGDFAAILCWSQDRFGRFDILDAGRWIAPLRDRGVYLETFAEGRVDWEDFAGRLVYAVTQEGKHAFLRDMSRNVTRGMLAKAKRGLWLGGPPPYGYALDGNKRLVPGDPAEVAVVRRLFDLYANTGTSLMALAKTFNAEGVPAPGATLWGVTAVRRVLVRPSYAGDFVWNRQREGKYSEVRGGNIAKTPRGRGQAQSGPEDLIVVRDAHPALVDRATFDRAQAKLVERRDFKTPRPGGGDFLLAGLLKCGDCGSGMVGSHVRCGKPGSRYGFNKFICSRYHRFGPAGCRCNGVRESLVVAHLIGAVKAEFLRPGRLAELKAEIRRQEEAERAGSAAPLAAVNRRVAELDTMLADGTARFLTAPPSLTEMLGQKLEEWRVEREGLLARRRAIAKPAVSVEALDDAAGRIAEGLAALEELAGTADPAAVREVLRSFVEKVELHFRHEPHGKRMRAVVTAGTLYLREELVSASFPIDVSGGKPLGGYYSFVEDFKRDRTSTTKTREAHYGNGWVRDADGKWQALAKARFTADANPVTNIRAKLDGSRFVLATGGDVAVGDVQLKATMERPAGDAKPPADLPEIK